MTADATVDVTSMAAQVLVGRQPITDRQGAVIGFELLYRSQADDISAVDGGRTTPQVSGERMTAEVVLGALSIGLDQLIGDKAMFCNAERSFLVAEAPVTLPPDRTVIEVLESVHIDDETVAGCRNLVDAGFRLALDDFVWTDGAERLLELASYVKLDFLAHTRTEITALVERCKPYGVVMLAEKVETPEDVAWAMANGFEMFQGYAIERPAVVRGQTVAPSSVAHVQLALTLLSADLELEDLEAILRREPGLVVQLLQMAAVGSHRGLRRDVHTVREALMLLGSTRVRQWLALTLLNGHPGSAPDGLTTALSRARMAELLAARRGFADAEFAFTAGLLSTLDVLLGVDLDHLGDTMEIDAALKAAAFRREGPVGALVSEVVRYQDSLHGRPAVGDPLGDGLAPVAAEAFSWAMPYVSSFDA
jgi:c-di-GMP-related signal transduction protein